MLIEGNCSGEDWSNHRADMIMVSVKLVNECHVCYGHNSLMLWTANG